jgi:hypothetical protein
LAAGVEGEAVKYAVRVQRGTDWVILSLGPEADWCLAEDAVCLDAEDAERLARRLLKAAKLSKARRAKP